MIQVYTDSFKLSQDYYDRVIFSLPIRQLECSCGEAGSLIFYGFYNRKVKSDGELIVFRIRRVKCRKCGKTHAILPASLVPCSQISLQDQQQIIYDASKPGHCSGVMERNPLVDENNAGHILRQFRRQAHFPGPFCHGPARPPLFPSFLHAVHAGPPYPECPFLFTNIGLPDHPAVFLYTAKKTRKGGRS